MVEVAQILDLQGTIGKFVSSSINISDAHITYQSKFMKSVLMVQEDGICTDATYRFFRKGHLVSSSVYDMN